jgi:hypothetical protein
MSVVKKPAPAIQLLLPPASTQKHSATLDWKHTPTTSRTAGAPKFAEASNTPRLRTKRSNRKNRCSLLVSLTGLIEVSIRLIPLP